MRRIVIAMLRLTSAAASLVVSAQLIAAPADVDLQRRVGLIGVPFVENAGQYHDEVRFAASTLVGTMFVTRRGDLVYALPAGSLTEAFDESVARPVGGKPHVAKTSHFIGADARRHHIGVATYEEVALDEAFRGIDVRLRAAGRNVEKIFTVRSGGDAGAIRMRVKGASKLEVTDEGALSVSLPRGRIVFTPPVAYQPGPEGRSPVRVAYSIAAPDRYGFEVGDYDRARPLVIDPLLQARYVGGLDAEGVRALAVHPVNGQVYAAGYTYSTDFPCTLAGGTCHDGARKEAGGDEDAFVARFDAGVTTLLQATYLGGSGIDLANALAFNPSTGEVLVGGQTSSSNFPCASSSTAGCGNGGQATSGGGSDGFLARLSADLETLAQATYFGGSAFDSVRAIAFSPFSNEVIAAGTAQSSNLPCVSVATTGCGAAPQPTIGGPSDGFVVRFNATLTAHLQATYVGGTGFDEVFAAAVHPTTGQIYVGGTTDSTNLPGANGFQGPKGLEDGFVVRFGPTLTTRLNATYIGTLGDDSVTSIALHASTGDVIVGGRTNSANFPCAGTGSFCTLKGPTDGYVARLNATLASLVYSTYLGGSGDDLVTAIVISPLTGDVYAAGQTTSADFPCTTAGGGCANGARSAKSAGTDAFVARFDGVQGTLLQSSYFGGSGTDRAYALAVHPETGAVLIGGPSTSNDLPCTTPSAAGPCGLASQSDLRGVEDGFIALFSHELSAAIATLDIDASAPDTKYDPATDGLLVMRYLFGFTGDTLTSGATGPTATRAPDAIAAYLRMIRPSLDVDDDGHLDPLTDGVLIVRQLFGLSGSALTNGAIGANAVRATAAAVQSHLQSLRP